MPGMEEPAVQKLLYETRRHASGTYTSNLPSPYQVNEGAKGGLLHLLSVRGIPGSSALFSEAYTSKEVHCTCCADE